MAIAFDAEPIASGEEGSKSRKEKGSDLIHKDGLLLMRCDHHLLWFQHLTFSSPVGGSWQCLFCDLELYGVGQRIVHVKFDPIIAWRPAAVWTGKRENSMRVGCRRRRGRFINRVILRHVVADVLRD